MDTIQFELNDKQIFICEEHHHVLKFWHQFIADQPYLLTFDYHTDLHRALQGYMNKLSYKIKPWKNQDEWDLEQSRVLSAMIDDQWSSIDNLKHDEHIDAALKSGCIKKALVYSHDSYHGKPQRVYCINGNEDYDGQLVINNSQSYHELSTVINTTELESRFRLFDLCIPRNEWLNNYILDIDLDFFQSRQSITPPDDSFFKMLIDNARGISIAKESGWVNKWREEHDPELSVEFLLEALLSLIQK